ncbi:SGNH/GDSL hydrolase family protein [Paraglaciecola sp. 20A4]|uniref:SGNH/GDSL hydrolase family protein n=1 Tax=Paraglaciecola sp. 20A4 TaxID=2687288 RepID=UPI00140CD47F|nr:SGNH/GDSL hydrolase family protein [Paraglaciecola sp. 20A4]
MKIIINPLARSLNFFGNKVKQTISLTAASLLIVSATATATPISSLNIFGDSLSDTGALTYLAPAFCPPDPYADCRFSNGPVWVELLADELGLSATTAYAGTGGTNYAIGGQRTDNVLEEQIPGFLALNGGVADADALYVIWAGGNDFLQNNPVDTYTPMSAVTNIIDSVLSLSAAGAMDFLIPNLPIADPWALAFNSALASSLGTIGGGLNITQVDAFSTFLDITLNQDEYPFTNVSQPCLNGVTACADPEEYLLWDEVHPTAAGHRFIAAAALAALPVSEPAMLAIFGIGLIGLMRTRRKTLA